MNDDEATAKFWLNLVELLDYVQPDEERDYEMNKDEAGEHHIIHAIRGLREWAKWTEANHRIDGLANIEEFAAVLKDSSRREP